MTDTQQKAVRELARQLEKAVNQRDELMDFIRFDLIARLTPATDPKGVADKHWRKLLEEMGYVEATQ